jgi:predicted HTH transcriptional regulator
MIDFARIEEYRENNRIEAKKALGGLPESIWETYSAFANAQGGLILLGVIETEDKSFASVELPDPDQLAADFWNFLSRPGMVSENILEPEDVQIVEAEGHDIVVIRIPKATKKQRPIYIGNDLWSGTYRRSGEGDYRCTTDEIQRMLNEKEL